MRDQIKKMAIGGGGATEDEQDFYAVSSSESDVSDEEEDFEPRASYVGYVFGFLLSKEACKSRSVLLNPAAYC